MAWSTLIPEFSDYGAQAVMMSRFMDKTYNPERSKEGFETADTIKDLYVTEAKAEVLRDLQIVLKLNPDDADDMARIDEISTENPSRLKQVIALMQTIIVLDSMAPAPDHANGILLASLRKKYSEIKSGFSGIGKPQGHTSVTTRNFNGGNR